MVKSISFDAYITVYLVILPISVKLMGAICLDFTVDIFILRPVILAHLCCRRVDAGPVLAL